MGEHVREIPSNKSLHGPPVGACHASCIGIIVASQEARQSPGARKLERYAAFMEHMMASRGIRTIRHVIAVNDLGVSTEYFLSKLGFERDFSIDGWEFLSFGDFQIMLGECPDEVPASETNNHSYFAHVLVEDADEIYAEFKANGAAISSQIEDKPWGHREFGVVTPEGHRIVFAQEIGK